MNVRARIAVAATVVVASFGAINATSSANIAPTPEFGAAASASESAERGARTKIEPEPAPAPALAAGINDPLLQTLFDLTNAERAAAGLPALRYNAQLGQAAQVHSEDQARRNTLTHYSANGDGPGDRIAQTGYRFRTWAENAAMGYRSAESVTAAWMRSSGHRANILRSTVTEIGLGVAYTSGGVPYWTQVFAAPRG